MIKLKENYFYEINDKCVLSKMDELRSYGLKLPKFDMTSERDQMLYVVSYENGFILHAFRFYGMPGDSGLAYFQIKNFLSENKFNFNTLIPQGFDPIAALLQVEGQVKGLAKRINYPHEIFGCIKDDFIGLVIKVPVTN